MSIFVKSEFYVKHNYALHSKLKGREKMSELQQGLNASEADSGGFDEFLSSIEESMLNMMKQSSRIPKDMKEQWEAFSSAINWEEKLIRYLLVFHAVLFIFAFLSRKNVNLQCFIFFLICGVVSCSEYLNRWCNLNWKEIASQNYFDEHGVFAGVFFAGPLLLILFFQLINLLMIASLKLIEVKRMELRRKKATEKAQKED